MVAIQFARGRALALAISALMLVTILPMPAAAQIAQPAADVWINPGDARTYQGTFDNWRIHTPFLSNNSFNLTVPVYNGRTTSVANVPVYAFLPEAPGWGWCTKTTLSEAQPQTDGTTIPGIGNASFNINNASFLAPGAYNVTIQVGVRPGTSAPECEGALTKFSTTDEPCVPSPTRSGGALACAVDDTANNDIRAYFVKEGYLDLQIKEIRWCAGPVAFNRGQTNPAACDREAMNGDQTYFSTPVSNDPEDESSMTFFEVVVENVPGRETFWANLTNYGSSTCPRPSQQGDRHVLCRGFTYELNVSAIGPGINRTWVSRNVTTRDRATEDSSGLFHAARSENLTLNGLAGIYNITVKLDGQGTLRKHPQDSAVDVGWHNATVASRDFTGNFTASMFKTTPESPYPYSGTHKIAGHVLFRNIGELGRPSTKTVNYTIYLDNLSWKDATGQTHNNTRWVHAGPFGPTGNATAGENAELAVIDWEYSTSGDGYLPPGKHTIYAAIDRDADLIELNETNNNFSLDIYLVDTTRPVFGSTPIDVRASGVGDRPPQTTFSPKQEFVVLVDVTDADPALNVTANFTLASNRNVTRYYLGERTPTPTRYSVVVDSFDFHNFSALGGSNDTPVPANASELWMMNLYANDSFGNNRETTSQPIRLVPYPIHTANASSIIRWPQPFPDATISYDGGTGENPNWTLVVPQNLTGHWRYTNGTSGTTYNQQNYTGNLQLNITNAKYVTSVSSFGNETPSICMTTNTTSTDPLERIGVGEESVTCATPSVQAGNNTFLAEFGKADEVYGGPGRWNYSVRITDVAGHTRVINGTLDVVDSPPEIQAGNLSNQSILDLEPFQNFTIHAKATDDGGDIAAAYVNFTRTRDGVFVNLTLDEPEINSASGIDVYYWNKSLLTGRGNTFGLGGTFNATLAVMDFTGHWNTRGIGNVTVKDEELPQITEYGVTPAVAEVNESVTFWAKARDTTNVSLRLEIFRSTGSSELLVDPITIDQTASGNATNYTATLNFSREQVHAWKLTPVDSLNRAGDAVQGTLTVRENLGPKFEVRSPSTVIDGVRYGSGTPRIEVAVFDTEGVIPTSVDMKVAGLPVDFTIAPAPGNLNGYLVTYEVKANKKFSHNDVVTVNMTADDNSAEHLRNYLNFSFTVDDIAPTARIAKISPSFRDQPAHVLNVSLNSKFELTADDNDGIPTQVESIRYRILGGGPGSAETVYTAPFRINDAPGVYTGPRSYTIQFWAEDAVGNFNRNFNVTTVFVDDTPPALFQFFPEGRQINATFVDDRVGVNRSVVWYRVNNEPFVPLPLVEADGAWSLELPEATKGDRVSYYLQAWDKLDNTESFGDATHPYGSFNASNRVPSLRITAPVEGGRIFRTVDLTWEAADEDRDALVFTIYVKAPGRSGFQEIAKLENTATRRYTIDTTRYPDGEYTFRLTVSDGGLANIAETNVTIQNRATAVGIVSVEGDGLPGQTMLVKAEITKAEALAEARLYLDGELVNSFPMNDEGRDGDEEAADSIYSVRVPVDAAGDYSVEIFTRYREDGELKESSVTDAATFSAKLTPSYILTEYGVIIAVIGLLAAVGIGVAVFVVMRRR